MLKTIYRKNSGTILPGETCRRTDRNLWRRPTVSASRNHSWTCAADSHSEDTE